MADENTGGILLEEDIALKAVKRILVDLRGSVAHLETEKGFSKSPIEKSFGTSQSTTSNYGKFLKIGSAR